MIENFSDLSKRNIFSKENRNFPILRIEPTAPRFQAQHGDMQNILHLEYKCK